MGRLNQVSIFWLKNNPNNSVAFFNVVEDFNERLLSTSFEIEHRKRLPIHLRILLHAVRQVVTALTKRLLSGKDSCEKVAKKNFLKRERLGTIRRAILALDGGAQLRVFLNCPAGAKLDVYQLKKNSFISM